jgi:Rad3-related DNA helicase
LTTWDSIFAPFVAQGREVREGQRMLGNAIINAIENGGSLVSEAPTGTGKSAASLIPIIHQVLERKKQNKSYRAAVSTETITLQNQLIDKDLPYFQSVYPGFTYRKLMGRANYVCLNQAALNARGDQSLNLLVKRLEARTGQLGDGELKDAERVLGRELDPDTWAKITGSSTFCGDNKCNTDKCFSTLARAKALTADIVICNHALLATDTEMKAGDSFGDGILGQLDCLVVDEGHALEPVLVDQWTKELTQWELDDKSSDVLDAIDKGRHLVRSEYIKDSTGRALEGLASVLTNIKKYYISINEKEGGDWANASVAMCLKHLNSPTPAMLALMEEYEVENPQRLESAYEQLDVTVEYLKKVVERAAELETRGRRDINKGYRAAKDLQSIVAIMQQALASKDGIVQDYGAYGAIVDGWVRKNGEPGLTIRLVPLDVSAKAKSIWAGVKTNILLSATLTDLTDGSFNYARQSIAFPDGPEIRVPSPFELEKCQLIYLTHANGNKVEGAQYDFDELVELLNVSKGRALVLFTSRRELDEAADRLRYLQSVGEFGYQIYVQEKDSNKEKLREAFREDTHSVLLATKSFFVGVDISGESLSLVALVKFPNPRWSPECQQRSTYWRTRGFYSWYEREALTVFQQAAGRLIRSSTDRGIVALLDHRAADTGTKIHKNAVKGFTALRSYFTRDLEVVQKFLG